MSTATTSPVMAFQADEIISSARALAHFVIKTPAERLGWKPKCEETGCSGKSVYEQLAEVIEMNRGFTAILQGKPMSEQSDGNFESPEAAHDQLLSSANELADVVRGLDESALTKSYELPWGTWSGRLLITVPAGHMAYHGGQVNYIQVLYGDNVFHVAGA